MDVATSNLFFALLSLAAGALAVLVAVAAVIARRAPDGTVAELLAELRPVALWLAFLVAAVATAGSLYYSEVEHLTPCKFCWYQRIAMYPQALILGIAAFRRDADVKRYLIPLSVIGAAVAAYHVYLERFPDAGGSCDPTVPCNVPWFEQFGFVTLAFMALTGFCAIIALLSVATSDRSTLNEDVDE